MNKIKLSIITPYYNTLPFTKKLAESLEPQLTDEVEWIIVDDGSHEKELDNMQAKVIHLDKNSGNASHPRNIGLDSALGDFITFVDSDDLVFPSYVEQILTKIDTEDFDYCYFSWRTEDEIFMILDEPEDWNKSSCNCIYKKETIGKNRFKENMNLGEDGDFNERVRKGKKSIIPEVLYFYNWNVREDNLSNLCKNGIIPFDREE